jgi:hypothetical protein
MGKVVAVKLELAHGRED